MGTGPQGIAADGTALGSSTEGSMQPVRGLLNAKHARLSDAVSNLLASGERRNCRGMIVARALNETRAREIRRHSRQLAV